VASKACERIAAQMVLSFTGPLFPAVHSLPEFDKEMFAGADGCLLRDIIESYDFHSVHAYLKNSAASIDGFAFGFHSMGLVQWYGDLRSARVGWVKLLDFWKQVAALVESGQRTWSEYVFEGFLCGYGALGDILLAGEMGLLREIAQALPGGIALRDPLVCTEWQKAICASPFMWESPDGYRMASMEAVKLQDRALAAVADEGVLDAEQVRDWLPRPAQLIDIARLHFKFISQHGAMHPSLLCSTLYMRFGAWDDAEAVAQGLLDIPPLGDGAGFGMPAMHRIEAQRLLARCRGARGDVVGACEVLELAITEAQKTGYVFYELNMLKEMEGMIKTRDSAAGLPGGVEGDGEASRSLQVRIDAVASKLQLGDCKPFYDAGWQGAERVEG
jgi:hypothetical protein